MNTLKRIAFISDLVKADLLAPAQGIAMLNHCDGAPDEYFVRCLADLGLEVQMTPDAARPNELR